MKLKCFSAAVSLQLLLNSFILSQTLPDTTDEQPIQYRRGIALQEGYISYDEYYSGKDMLEEKRRLFPIESTGVWTELNPKVPRVDYIGVDFINPDTGWAVGLWGAVIKTTNAGQSWKTIPTPTGEILLKVHSYNGKVVMAVGHNGTILRSSDGGESFSLLTGITTQELWGVKMLNDTLGWICGRNNTLLKTTDAGLSWQAVVTGYNYHYWQFDFLTEDYFMIACSQGRVLKTTNGGQSFTEYQAGSTQDLYTIDIIDSLHIAAAGNYGKNVYSSDGGINWVENTQLTSSSVNWVQFINIEIGFAAVESSWSLYKTTDRGQSWSLAGFYKVGEWQFELLNENIGYGVGAGLKVTKTEDGFNTGYNLFLNKNWSDVFFINEMKGFFASASLGEKLYKTEDGGITYQIIENSPSRIYDILFLDGLTGFLGSNTIYKTTDGGENWYSTNGAGQATKIFFITPLIGWAVGGSNIYKTTDGGDNWVVQFTHINDSFTSIFFVDSFNGWATSRYVHQTTDGGENWIQRTDIPFTFSTDVYFQNLDTGWVARRSSFNTSLFKTTNGGLNWTGIPAILGASSIYLFPDESHWMVAGSVVSNIILYKTYITYNAGNNWIDLSNDVPTGFSGFSAITDIIGYAGGSIGLILRYYDTTYIPVKLISFEGRTQHNKIILTWQTASELNNKGFEIERSTDKKHWEMIGFIEGNGTTTEINDYVFTDNLTGNYSRKLFYRLKQIDFDRTFEYSDIIQVEVGTPSEFFLSQNYPNPFNPETKIDYRISEETFVNISLYDVTGRKIKELVNEKKQPGYYILILKGGELSSSIYFYRLTTTSGYTAVKKLTIIK